MKFILIEQTLLEDIDSMKKYYPNIPEEQFMESVVSNKIRFRLVEDNELEKRAMKHRKKQKGLSPFGYFPDYDKGVDAFNGLSNTSFDSSSMESASMGESLNKELYRYKYTGESSPIYTTAKDRYTAERNIKSRLKTLYKKDQSRYIDFDLTKLSCLGLVGISSDDMNGDKVEDNPFRHSKVFKTASGYESPDIKGVVFETEDDFYDYIKD